MNDNEHLAELRAVSKRFGGTQALDSVDLAIRRGEVHALVGENGAGKSTLGKIVAGLYAPDSGEVWVDGEVVSRWDPIRAQRTGIVMIAQELSLVPQLTVAQNVFLGAESATAGVLTRGSAARFAELMALADFDLDPSAIVGDLKIAEQQKVEIVRALARDARLIVMDEPTSSLTAQETAQLHELIRVLRRQNRSVVYVSHFLDSVLEVADRITIMRDGVRVRTGPAAEETKETIVRGMLGRELSVTFPPRRPPVSSDVAPVLTLENVSTAGGAQRASLTVRPGEIVGLLGLVGSGRSEIARAIAGADRITSGTLTFLGKARTRWNTPTAISAGVVMVPEDRHAQGLVLERDVKENISLSFLGRFAPGGVIRPRRERDATAKVAADLDMRPPKVSLGIAGLSGGNQQKALLGKWLIGDPAFIILDEPTRGVDVGAKATIYRIITDIAARGVGVLLISSEHEEVLALSNRAYIVQEGSVVDEVEPSELGVADLLNHLFAVETRMDS